MEINSHIKEILLELLKKIETLCKDERAQGHSAHDLSFPCDEDPIKEFYSELRDYFLPQETDERLNSFHGNSKYDPPWTKENLFSQNLEILMEWAAICFSRPPLSQSPEKFLEIFLQTYNLPPLVVSYIPIWGVNIKAGHTFKKIPLIKDIAEIIIPSYEEKIIIGNHSKKKSYFEIAIKFIGNDFSEINTLVSSVRTIFLALLQKKVYCPDLLVGIRTPWHPWIYQGGPVSDSEPPHGNHQIWDIDTQFFAKHWPSLYPDKLDRYSITTKRYFMSNERDNLEDRVIDLGISLESLLEAEEDIKETLKSLIPLFVGGSTEEQNKLAKQISSFYDLRSAIVHGNRKKLKKIQSKLNRANAVSLCNDISRSICQTLKTLLLNEKIQSKNGQNKFKQKPSKLIGLSK